MTSKERVNAAMERRPVDRIPVFPVITTYLASRVMGRPMRNFALDPMLRFEGYRAVHARFGFDGFEVGLGQAKDTPPPSTKTVNGVMYLTDESGERLTARLDKDDMPVALDSTPMLAEKSALDKISVTPASWYEQAGCTDPVRQLVEDLGESAFIAGVAAGQTMNSLAAWRGSEQAMFDLADDPLFVHEIMARATDISIEIGKALISAGVDGIYIGDAWASASIISPLVYEEFCLPCHHRTAEAFHELGVKVYLHICGNSGPILEMMADTGVDAIEPLDVDGGVNLEDAKARVGSRVCLKGGLSTKLLLHGTPGEVFEEASRCVEILGPSGYILGSADDIPRDAPLANVEAMVRAANPDV